MLINAINVLEYFLILLLQLAILKPFRNDGSSSGTRAASGKMLWGTLFFVSGVSVYEYHV